jgi:hypothetical protein
MKDTTYPSTGMGNAGSAGTRQASNSAADRNPWFTSFCRWLGVMVDGVQSCSAMAQGGRKFNTFKTLVPLPIFLFFFLLYPFFILLFFFVQTQGRR